jgi:hypothetical protein
MRYLCAQVIVTSILNPKSECSKLETNPNFQMTECPKLYFGHLDLENLSIVSNFGFRASDLCVN